MRNLAEAASIVINNDQRGGMTPEKFLHFFGACFVRYTMTHQTHYGKIIRVYRKNNQIIIVSIEISIYLLYFPSVILQGCGRYFTDFLMCTDNLHLQMKYVYPKMVSPSIHVSQVDPGGVVLTYRTSRKGYSPYIIGNYKYIYKILTKVQYIIRLNT